MIIDCHVHLNSYYNDDRPLAKDHCDRLFREMDSCGIEHAVVITSYTNDCDRPSVQEVLMVLAENPRTSVVEGLRWRSDDRSDLFNMEERIRKKLVRGIKLYPGYEPYGITDPSLESVFRLASKYGVPVMIHTGDTYSKRAKVRRAHPLLVDDVAVDYPDVNFIMCHAGNPWFIDAAEVLYKNENVYADISGLTLGAFKAGFEQLMLGRLKDLILYLGDAGRQLLYGSDWPLVEMPSYVAFLEDLELPAEHREGIAWRTAARLFQIDVEAAGEAARRSSGFRSRSVN